VLQTFCAVWVLGNANSERKERNLDLCKKKLMAREAWSMED
jgi:hypothetical protein